MRLKAQRWYWSLLGFNEIPHVYVGMFIVYPNRISMGDTVSAGV